MGHGFYSYIHNIPAENIVQYVGLAIFIIILSNRVKLSNYTLLGIVVSIIISYYLYDREQTVDSNYLNVIKYQLGSPIIKDAKYLYLDSEIVHILFHLQKIRPNNNLIYRDLVKQLDKFLNIYLLMEKGNANIGELYELALDYRTKSLNSLHSMIHKAGVEQINYLNDKRNELQKILNEHLDKMYLFMRYYYGKQPINMNLKIYRKNDIQGRDPLINHNYDFH